MSIFLAWIIVGFCSAMIIHNKATSVMGKYHFGINLMSSFENKPDCQDIFTTDPKEIAHWHKVGVGVVYFVAILFAPAALWGALKTTWKKQPFAKMKAENDEFVKRHGMVF